MANRLKITTSPWDGVVSEVGGVVGDGGVVGSGKTRSWAVSLLSSLLADLTSIS